LQWLKFKSKILRCAKTDSQSVFSEWKILTYQLKKLHWCTVTFFLDNWDLENGGFWMNCLKIKQSKGWLTITKTCICKYNFQKQDKNQIQVNIWFNYTIYSCGQITCCKISHKFCSRLHIEMDSLKIKQNIGWLTIAKTCICKYNLQKQDKNQIQLDSWLSYTIYSCGQIICF